MLAIILALTMTLSSLNAAIAEEAAAVSQSSQQASTSQPGGNRPPEKPGETFGQGGNPPAGGPGAAAQSVSYTAATEISEAAVLTDENYASDTADENALLVSAAQEVQLVNSTVTKTGNSDGGDSCSFYGMNAAVLAKDGAEVTIQGGAITSEANGVFSYGGNGGQNGAAGDGTTVNISDTSILTTGDNAGGIMTTGGGVTNASNLTIQTVGRSSAAIRTDRGGGTVTVEVTQPPVWARLPFTPRQTFLCAMRPLFPTFRRACALRKKTRSP